MPQVQSCNAFPGQQDRDVGDQKHNYAHVVSSKLFLSEPDGRERHSAKQKGFFFSLPFLLSILKGILR